MMKCALIGLCVLSLSAGYGKQISDVLSLSPEHPRIGQQITVSYHGGAPSARLKDADSMEVQVLVYRNCVHEYDNEPARIDAPLHREGDQWSGTFTLDDPMAKYVLLRVASGEARDDNDGRCWDALVYGAGESPVRGACLQRGTYHAGWGYFSFTSPKDVRDPDAAKADFEREMQLYPDNRHAAIDLWDLEEKEAASDEEKTTLRGELDRLRTSSASDEPVSFRIYSDYLLLGDTSEALRLRTEMTARDPQGDFARRAKWSDILRPENEPRRLDLMDAYFKEFTGLAGAERRVRLKSYFSSCLSKKEYDRAHDVLTLMQNTDGSMYNQLAWPMVDKGVELEKAVAWAEKGVALNRNPDPSARPLSVSERDWLQSRGENLGMVLDTYGYGLLQLGRHPEAEKSFAEAYRLLDGKDPDVNGRYVQSLLANGQYADAVRIGSACVKSGTDSPALIAGVQKALVAEEGTATPYEALSSEAKTRFEDLVAEAKRVKTEEIRKKVLASRMSTPSIDFTLKDLQGGEVTLSSLKGRVVVIDFWATWCGPCKSSFPYFQSVYEKYKGNDHVVFLAVDTWEREKGVDATVANAKKFIASNNYTFPVLIDALSGKKAVDAYGVEGIPTKFIVDKKGNIAFKSVGFEGSDMEIELTQQIEAALADPAN